MLKNAHKEIKFIYRQNNNNGVQQLMSMVLNTCAKLEKTKYKNKNLLMNIDSNLLIWINVLHLNSLTIKNISNNQITTSLINVVMNTKII